MSDQFIFNGNVTSTGGSTAFGTNSHAVTNNSWMTAPLVTAVEELAEAVRRSGARIPQQVENLKNMASTWNPDPAEMDRLTEEVRRASPPDQVIADAAARLRAAVKELRRQQAVADPE